MQATRGRRGSWEKVVVEVEVWGWLLRDWGWTTATPELHGANSRGVVGNGAKLSLPFSRFSLLS